MIFSANRGKGLAKLASPRVGMLLVLAATYFLYATATGFPFVYDDTFQILQNDHLDSWRFLPVYFTEHVWSHIPQIQASFYRPLFLVWLRLNNLVFGHEPSGWHFTTILLHLAVTGLVYWLAAKLLRNRVGGLIAALVFGLHPIHVEAVGWVSGVTEPLGAVFFLGSFLCYLKARDQEGQSGWISASLFLFCCALLVKETAAALPLVIFAYEMSRANLLAAAATEKRKQFWRRSRLLLPYAVVVIIYLPIRALVLGGVVHPMTDVPVSSSLLSLPWLLCFYLRELVWPAGLSPLYDPVHITQFTQAAFLLPSLMLLFCGVMAWRLSRRRSGNVAFLLAWFLLTLAPALLLFCVAQPAEAFHDRYLYLPSIAFCVAAGGVFSAIAKSNRKGYVGLALAGLLCLSAALAFCTRRQLAFWSGNYELFQHATEVAPHNEIANLNFAWELFKTHEYQRALRVSQSILGYDPGSAKAMGSAGQAAFLLGDYGQAEDYYSEAVEIDTSRPALFQYLGLTRMKLGRYQEALAPLKTALEADPQMPGLHYSLGLTLTQLGQWQEAASQFRAELEENPGNLAAQRDLQEAEAEVSKAASVAPSVSASKPTPVRSQVRVSKREQRPHSRRHVPN